MDHRQAFYRQAKSDRRLLQKLLDDPDVEPCHRLHYLQMCAEKLAKAYLTPPNGPPPPMSHAVIVRLVKSLPQTPGVRQRLGLSDTARLRAYARSLQPVAEQIERLAPALAGLNGPNAEYPWQPRPGVAVVAPADHRFTRLRTNDPKVTRFLRFMDRLLADEVLN